MKPTLKSLLITSVLTLPTVLGSDTPGSDALDNQDPRNTASNTPVDNVASGGSQTKLQQTQPHILRLPLEILRDITGFASKPPISDKVTELANTIVPPPTFTLGFLPQEELYTLFRVSKGFYNLIFEPLVEIWIKTNPIKRFLQAKPTPEDNKLFPFLVCRYNPFDDLLDLLFGSFNARAFIEKEKNLVRLIDHYPLTDIPRTILIGVLQNATPKEILWAAEALLNLGNKPELSTPRRSAHHEMSKRLCEQLANQHGAKAASILKAAETLLNLGDNHPENSKERTTFHKKALDLYEKVDTRMDLTVGNVVDIAKGLHRLGDHKKALTLYYKALESQSKTVDDILNIAYGFLKFANASPKDSDERNAYLERAAELFEKATNKLNDLSCAQSGVNGFRSLEKMYPEGSPEQIFYHKKVEHLSGFAGAHGFV